MPGYNTGFKNHELVAAIERAPYAPGRLGAMGLWTQRGVARTSIDIEYKDNKLSLIPAKERGSRDSTYITEPKRKLFTFKTIHLPQETTIRPDDLPDVRRFGTEDGAVDKRQIISQFLADMRQNFEVTWEYHRMGCLNGIVLDADGTTELVNLWDEFDITETTIYIDLDSSDLTVKAGANSIIRTLQAKLGATPFGSVRVLCGDEFFDKITMKAETTDAFNRWRDGQFLRDNQTYQAFEYAGIIWENYHGEVGNVNFMPSDSARVVPMGVPQMFMRFNGPDDTWSGVGRVGRPITITEESLPHDGGINLRAQSNVLFLCTRPGALLKLVDGTAPSS